MLVCVTHYWCGKEWVHILHKSKGRLLFQECTGSNPPDKDLTYNHKEGLKMGNGCPPERAQECHRASSRRSPQTYPSHISVLCVWIYTKHESLGWTENLYETQVLSAYLSTSEKASQAPYLLLRCIIASGEMAGDNWNIGVQVLLLWMLIQEIEEWMDVAMSLCWPLSGGSPLFLSRSLEYHTGLTSPAKFCCSE